MVLVVTEVSVAQFAPAFGSLVGLDLRRETSGGQARTRALVPPAGASPL